MTTRESDTIWDRSHEAIDREELAQLQLERLQASAFRAYRNVAFYRKRFDTLEIAPEDLRTLASLRDLPFTTREDLCQGYPYDLLAVPLREVVRLFSSAWGCDHPTVCAFTRNDLRHWTDSIARLLSAGGVTHDDVAQIIFSTNQLANGLGFHGGAERIGASVIPAAAGGIERQLAIMQDFNITTFIGSAGDAAALAAAVGEQGLDVRRLSLRVGFFGTEPWSEALRAQIESRLGITALDAYTLSELGGPGVAGECMAKAGLHLAEDQFLAEIVDPVTGDPVPEGETGELVLTTLTREALPLIRFRTRDLTRLTLAPCACGRTLARLGRISGRTDGLILIQGGRLHPDQVRQLLHAAEGAEPTFQIILDRKDGREEIEILAEFSPDLAIDSPGKVLALEARLEDGLQRETGLHAKVRLVEPQTIARLAEAGSGPVIDRRA